MGNTKSKKAKAYNLYDDFYDDFMYDDYGYNPKPATVAEVIVEFDKLPAYTLPEFLKESKENIKEKEKEFKKSKKLDAISLIEIMNNILTERDYKDEATQDGGAPVWAGGIGFGGGSTDNFNAKKLRDTLYAETNEREYVLIHAFSLFSDAITSAPPRMQRRVRRLFNRSAIRHELGEYLVNDSMLDITKHAWFYWYAWRMLISLATTPNLRGCIFRGGFYLHMQKLIDVAELYKKRMEKMPANVQESASTSKKLVDEIISSRVPLERNYQSYKEEKITPMRDSGSSISTIDLASDKPRKFFAKSKRRAKTMHDVSLAQHEKKKEVSEDLDITSNSVIREAPLKPQKKTKRGKKSIEQAKETKILDSDIVDGSKESSKESKQLETLKKEISSTPKDNSKEEQQETETLTKESSDNGDKEVLEDAVIVKKKRRRKKKKKSVQEDTRSQYVKELSEILFDSCDFPTHIFEKNSASLSKGALSRTMLEIQSLADSLPSCLTDTSGIFLRTNDKSLHLMKALIVGPPGTPYSLGLFEFDLCIPNTYPNAPPLCKIATTGNQTFRFNPNLYANGKVCLSLIGTWSGAPEEQWDPKVSTLFQVFISIQSLILVENPYYNEPGYQFSENDVANLDYNRNIRQGTTRLAILGQIRNKNSVFRDVIVAHCRNKKQEILQQSEEWSLPGDLIKELTLELDTLDK